MSAEQERPSCTCGYLGWTVERYGRITHKEACPHRTDPWTQANPQTAEWITELQAQLREAQEQIETLRQQIVGANTTMHLAQQGRDEAWKREAENFEALMDERAKAMELEKREAALVLVAEAIVNGEFQAARELADEALAAQDSEHD